MNRKIFTIFLILLGLLVSDIMAVNEREIGFLLTLSPEHDYYVYFSDERGRVSALRDNTTFSGFELDILIPFKKILELNIWVRKFGSENLFIEGGLWRLDAMMLGISGGIRHSIEFKYTRSKNSNKPYEFPLDFSVGGYFSSNLFSSHYEFISGIENEDVESGIARVSIGLYTSVQLRLKFVRDKWGLSIYPAFGFKYFAPLNNFDYCHDPNAALRLRRQSFFVGVYFRI